MVHQGRPLASLPPDSVMPSLVTPTCPPLPVPQAAYPAPWVRQSKFWPTTCRVDNVYGDRNLVVRMPDVPETPAGTRGAEVVAP